MKKSLLFSAMVLLSKVLVAQDYQISFAVSGENETIIDSVVVHNIAQGHLITLQGDDTLHLVASTSEIGVTRTPNERIQVYPNPFTNRANIVFPNAKQGSVQLSVFDMTGRIVTQKNFFRYEGKTVFGIGGLPAGAYVVQVKTEASVFSKVILSNDGSGNMPEIQPIGTGKDVAVAAYSLKSSNRTGEMVDMQYNDGDTLSFTAYLDSVSSEKKIVPVASSTLGFDFQTNKENISASADITVEGGSLMVTDESGNRIVLSFPPGAVMDTANVTLTLLGEDRDLSVDERQLRPFEISPVDISLYEPVTITINYNSPVSDIEKAVLFRIHSEEMLTPLGDQMYTDTSVAATTLILGDFAEGKMTLEQLDAQFDLLVSSIGISWDSSQKSADGDHQTECDTRLHKAAWDDWKETIGAFITIFNQRNKLGYYNDLEEGQPSYEEEQEILCEKVVSMAVKQVLDQCIPDDPCDRDYAHTIASMVRGTELLGCEGATFDQVGDRFDQLLLNCESFLTISSVLDIESGGLMISTSGTVPITVQMRRDSAAAVNGAGTLEVSGSGSGGGACTGTVSGESFVTVVGQRNAAYVYELQIFIEQNAWLTTVCPDGSTYVAPLVGEDVKVIHLSMANDFSYSEDEPVDEGQFIMDITLDNPYISLPYEE